MNNEQIEGLVERVTFFNEENGFAVLRVKVRGQRDLVTVLGSLPAVNGGEWIVAEGQWTRDPQHGLQFRAEAMRSSAPNSREGIEKYLGSGLIKGIGPVLAKKLVTKFGEQVFDVIDTKSARLEEVDKVGPERRRRIKAAWAEQKVVREIMVFLHSHGASASRAVRIYKTYGDQAIDRVRANPYQLARDIHGIGFKTADGIARKLGIAVDSPQRAAAGLRHTLFNATNEGHCALPDEILVRHTATMLEVDESVVTPALAQALEGEDLERDEITGQPLIYLPGLLGAEKSIARRILSLSSESLSYPDIDLPSAVDWYEKKKGRSLSPSQREALSAALGPGYSSSPAALAWVRRLCLTRCCRSCVQRKFAAFYAHPPVGPRSASPKQPAWKQRRFTACSNSDPAVLVSYATSKIRSTATCWLWTKRRWWTFRSCTPCCARCLAAPGYCSSAMSINYPPSGQGWYCAT